MFSMYISQLRIWKRCLRNGWTVFVNELYKIISKSGKNCKNIVASVVEGEFLGEKAYFSNKSIRYESKTNGFLSKHSNTIIDQVESGIICIEGNRVFCEILGEKKKLVICGGGHVAIPIIKIGVMADFAVIVIEDRYSFADAAIRAGADQVICEPFDKGLEKIEGDQNTYFVIVTRGHRYDQLCLEAIIKKKNAYIGMIGSKVRVEKVKKQLVENGVDVKSLEKVFTPIGLDIKAETPVEIGISILAEIIEVKNKKKQSYGYPKKLLSHINDREPGMDKKVMATIISRKGSAPREVGTKMLVFTDRTIETLGGGCVEAEIKMKAFNMLIEGAKKPELHRIDMTGWQAEEEGMVCGGVIEVLLELIR